MRKLLVVLGVAIFSLPMLFVLWLLLAVKMPEMDATTVRLPTAIRATVANAIVGTNSWGKEAKPRMERAINIDPANAQAWTALCESFFGVEQRTASVPTCQKAISLDPSAGNYNGLGNAEEKAGDNCAAEDSYTVAASKSSDSGTYGYIERMSVAALRCGKAYDARAGLEAAIDLEKKDISNTQEDDDERENEKADLLLDREYLIVAADQLADPKLAQSVCMEAHPEWKRCACSLNEKSEVKCTGAK